MFFALLILSAALFSSANADTILPRLSTVTLGNLTTASGYDVVIFVNDRITELGAGFETIESALCQYYLLDSTFSAKTQIMPFNDHPSKRLMFAPTGQLNTDISDSRQIYNAALQAAKMAFSSKLRNPLFILGPLKSGEGTGQSWLQNKNPKLIMALGAFQGFYMPLVLREDISYPISTKFDRLGISDVDESFLKIAAAIEEGRIVARDVCAGSPERMSAPSIEKYYGEAFQSGSKFTWSSEKIDANKWPFCAAVNRAVQDVEKYNGRIIKMRYMPDGFDQTSSKSIIFVGKGITYDTGGSELKTGGYMKFMSNDKCGAAAIAGFMKTVTLFPLPIKHSFSAHLAFVRNGIGANAYVFDEIITLKSGVRAMVGSPDAEGRNVMADMMYDAVKEAKSLTNPHIFTVATLTGAVGRSFGLITAILDNGAAHRDNNAQEMVESGNRIADLLELNTLRREDYEVNRPDTEGFDIYQFNNKPKTSMYRGFQLPAGFMATASGLNDWGLPYPTTKAIKYTHMDVASSVGRKNSEATATPVSVFVSHFLLKGNADFAKSSE